jgi:hypothetical protein
MSIKFKELHCFVQPKKKISMNKSLVNKDTRFGTIIASRGKAIN